MERTSLIIGLRLASSTNYPNLTLVDGLPDASSLSTYFTALDLVPERNDLQEVSEFNQMQGESLQVTIRAHLYRDDNSYANYLNAHLMAYVEMSNGEKYLIGNNQNPLTYSFSRNSGAGNADQRETEIRLTGIFPQ